MDTDNPKPRATAVKRWLYAIIIILLLTIGILAYFDVSKNDLDSSDKSRNTPGQTQLPGTISPDSPPPRSYQPPDADSSENTDVPNPSQDGPRRTKEGIGGQGGYQ